MSLVPTIFSTIAAMNAADVDIYGHILIYPPVCCPA